MRLYMVITVLESERLCIENNDTINSGNCLKTVLLNKNFNAKITIPKGEKLAYLTILNSNGQNINVTYIKF